VTVDPGRTGADPGVDLGVTHVALPVRDLDASVDFYARFADMHVVHRRDETDGTSVAWISDLTRPFVLVLIETIPDQTLGGMYSHIGLGVAGRDEVDHRCELARAEGRKVFGPNDYGPPVGYWAIIADPDGHNLEISHGQEVRLAVRDAKG
jgi:catechol 2,3-dioxygenase-like lactoylglutathione lyase family enzyme